MSFQNCRWDPKLCNWHKAESVSVFSICTAPLQESVQSHPAIQIHPSLPFKFTPVYGTIFAHVSFPIIEIWCIKKLVQHFIPFNYGLNNNPDMSVEYTPMELVKAFTIQDIVDLWVMGIYFTDYIQKNSMLGFMGIYGDSWKGRGWYKSP